MRAKKIFPVRTLQEQVTAFEAALTQVLAEAKPGHVHKLRTSTRRLEGTLALLSLLSEVPEHKREAKKVSRRLRKLRRAAGAVRDCDVQIGLVEAQEKVEAGKKLDEEIRQLSKHLEKHRDRETTDLVGAVTRQRQKFVPQVERLLQVLEPADDLAVSEAQMVSTVQGWVSEQLKRSRSEKTSDEADRLHGIRKTAKLARYIAETAPDTSRVLQQLGREYEALQQSGGTWHDWLTLEHIARRTLGASSILSERFAEQCASSLKDYERALAESSLVR